MGHSTNHVGSLRDSPRFKQTSPRNGQLDTAIYNSKERVWMVGRSGNGDTKRVLET